MNIPSLRPLAAPLLAAALLATGGHALGADPRQPGQGVRVQPLKSSIAEETFQTLLVMKGLERLGYDVQPIREVEYPAAHLAISNGDASILVGSPISIGLWTAAALMLVVPLVMRTLQKRRSAEVTTA